MPKALTPAMVSPNGFWIKTHFYRDGDMLKARSFMVVAGDPVVFEVGVNLRVLEAALVKYHNRLESQYHNRPTDEKHLVSGCMDCDDEIGSVWSSIKGAAKGAVKGVKKSVTAIAKSKVVKAVAKTAKSIVKSKVVGTMSAGLAVAFPPVGLPAAAAYASANAAMAAIDRGNALRKAAVATVSKAKATGKPVKLPNATKTALAKAIALEKKARATIQKVANTAQYSTDPNKKAQAQRTMGVLSIAAKARAATKAIPAKAAKTSTTARAIAAKPTAVVTGLVVTERGLIVKGKFNEVSAGKIRGQLYRRGRSLPGQFNKIGCANPWPNIH